VIIKKSPQEIDKMAASGAILVRTLRMLEGKVREGVTTAELDEAAERYIRSQGAEPAFKGYRGFPGSICTSPNSMVVHGIPGPYRLERGDIISIDVGVVLDGWVADAARTFAVGQVTPVAHKLLDTTRAALLDAVEQCRAGNRLGDVSSAVQERVESEGMSIVRSLVGHGIGRSMHEDPQIPNYGDPGADRCSRRAWSSPSSRWSTPAATRCAWATTAGRSSPRTARWRPTSSSRSRSRPTGRAC
jgi:methionyl aminopeptidase